MKPFSFDTALIFAPSMRVMIRLKAFVACVFLLCLTACGEAEIDTEKIIAEIAAERIESFHANFQADCQEKVLAAAKLKADSLILDRARRMRTLDGRPPKPLRPGEQAPKVLESPLPLRPLFPFEIRFDTLLRDSLYRDSLRLDSMGISWPPIDSSLIDSLGYE